jgi:hypothetical protein
MKLVFYGLVLAAGVYFAIQSPTGQALLLRAEAAGGRLATNIVGNMSR